MSANNVTQNKLTFWLLNAIFGVCCTLSTLAAGYAINTIQTLNNEVHEIDCRVIGIESSRFTPLDGLNLQKEFTQAVNSIRDEVAGLRNDIIRLQVSPDIYRELIETLRKTQELVN